MSTMRDSGASFRRRISKGVDTPRSTADVISRASTVAVLEAHGPEADRVSRYGLYCSAAPPSTAESVEAARRHGGHRLDLLVRGGACVIINRAAFMAPHDRAPIL
jgi:hypothetical protein